MTGFIKRDIVNFDSMRLAEKLTEKLDPFYSKAERDKIKDVFYQAIEEDICSFERRMGEMLKMKSGKVERS